MFSQVLNKLIDIKNIKQSELAYHLKIHPSQVSRYCSGESEPNFTMIKNIANYLDIEPAIFFEYYTPGSSDGSLFFMNETIYKIAEINKENNCCIFIIKFLKARYWNKEVNKLAEKYGLKVTINLVKGKLLVNNNSVDFFAMSYDDEVYLSENTTVQVIVCGEIKDYLTELKTILNKNSLL